jgi:Glycosyltransferase family 87
VKIDRIAWIWVLATFAIVILFAARDLSFLFFQRLGEPGWDLRVACASFAALSEGKDPYIVSNIGGDPSFPAAIPYAIVAAYPAKFLCPIDAVWPKAFVIIYLLFLVCSCSALTYLLLGNVIETALVAIVSISAFDAFRWIAMTGNIAILEVPFAVLTILAVHQRRFVVGGLALGLMSSLKMLPLVGVLAFLILPIGWAQKARAVAGSLLTFGGVQIINIMVSGPYRSSFLKELFGGIPGQASPYIEEGFYANPDFIDFIFRVFGAFSIEKTSLIASAIALCCLAVGGLVTMLAQRTDETDKFGTVRLFSLAYLVCMLFLFRLKPYAFAALIPFAIAAVMFPVRALRYVGYLVPVLMPWLWWPSLWSGTVPVNMGLTREFYQTMSLVVFVVVAFGFSAIAPVILPRWQQGALSSSK